MHDTNVHQLSLLSILLHDILSRNPASDNPDLFATVYFGYRVVKLNKPVLLISYFDVQTRKQVAKTFLISGNSDKLGVG